MSIRASLVGLSSFRYLGFAINFTSIVFIARLLTPEEVGIFSLGVGIVALAHKFRDAGVGSFIVQHRNLTEGVLRSAFAVLVMMAWTISLILFLGSGLAAAFYDEPRLATVIQILACNFLILPFGSITLAVLHREKAFMKIGLMGLSAQVLGAVVSVSLAMAGFSYASLAWGSLASAAGSVGMALMVRPGTVSYFPSFRQIREVFGFGAPVTAVNLAAEVSFQAPEYFLGFFQTFTSIGLYSRARGQIDMFSTYVLSGIQSVLFPYIAEKVRKGEEVRSSFLYVLTCFTGLTWPFYVGLGLLAFPIMRVVFGNNWDDAVPLVQILSVAAFFLAMSPITNNFLMATGNVKIFVKTELIMNIINILLLFFSAQISVEAMAASRIAFAIIWTSTYLVIQRRIIEASWATLGKAYLPSLHLFLICGIPLGIFMALTGGGPERVTIQFFGGGAILALSWLVGLYVTRHPLGEEIARPLKLVRQRLLKGRE